MLQLIFENPNFLTLNKPSGLVVHPFDFSDEQTLLDFLQEKSPQIFNIKNEKRLQDGRAINLGGIVHKLDRETSGIMVVAKDEATHKILSEQFRNHQVKKVYHAFVIGKVEPQNFVIDAPLGREKKSYRQSTNVDNQRGEMLPAVTNVKVLSSNEKISYLELIPETGRTHQLRAHLYSINHPIIGDKVYGDKNGETFGFERLALHAYSLSFILNNETFSFTAELPKDFLEGENIF